MNRLSESESDDKVSMFVGMDLHKNYMQIAVMNEEGRVLERTREETPLLCRTIGGIDSEDTRKY
ncbi:MAG: hypothetical protein WA364_09060 [Candidatus Nitrosopolaris sp.]